MELRWMSRRAILVVISEKAAPEEDADIYKYHRSMAESKVSQIKSDLVAATEERQELLVGRAVVSLSTCLPFSCQPAFP